MNRRRNPFGPAGSGHDHGEPDTRSGTTQRAQERPGGFGAHPGMAMPAEKAKDLRGTLKRLLAYLKPSRLALFAVFVTAIVGAAFAIVSPKVLGRATTILFEGSMMKLRGVPGAAVDLGAILRILATLIVLYLVSALFNYLQQLIMARIAQKTVYDMREDVI